jgi:hypothetical protein
MVAGWKPELMLSPEYKPIRFDSPLTLSENISLEVQLLLEQRTQGSGL